MRSALYSSEGQDVPSYCVLMKDRAADSRKAHAAEMDHAENVASNSAVNEHIHGPKREVLS